MFVLTVIKTRLLPHLVNAYALLGETEAISFARSGTIRMERGRVSRRGKGKRCRERGEENEGVPPPVSDADCLKMCLFTL